LRDLGFEQDVLIAKHNTIFAVRRLNAQYHLPVKFNDLLTVQTLIKKVGCASLVFTQKIMHSGQNQVLFEAQVTVACLHADSFKPCGIPLMIKEKIMKYLKIITMSCVFVLTSPSFASGMEDDPVVTKVMGEVELRSTDGANPRAWNIEAWIGKDLNKFWVKTKGERVAGHTEKSELQWLYSKAITPFCTSQFHFTHYLSYNRVVFHTTCK
jgi:YbgC/YbaW family acyl-CoA thioester hydrolase